MCLWSWLENKRRHLECKMCLKDAGGALLTKLCLNAHTANSQFDMSRLLCIFTVWSCVCQIWVGKKRSVLLPKSINPLWSKIAILERVFPLKNSFFSRGFFFQTWTGTKCFLTSSAFNAFPCINVYPLRKKYSFHRKIEHEVFSKAEHGKLNYSLPVLSYSKYV